MPWRFCSPLTNFPNSRQFVYDQPSCINRTCVYPSYQRYKLPKTNSRLVMVKTGCGVEGFKAMNLEVVILAAGKGSRMCSSLPKVMHKLAGRPLLTHVLEAATALEPTAIHVVVGHGSEQIESHFSSASSSALSSAPSSASSPPLNWVIQERQLGTGHAVLQALPGVADDSCVLVLYGDCPMIRPETLKTIVSLAQTQAALLTAEMPDPSGLGRILRDEKGNISGVVEDRDASAGQKLIVETSTGVLAAPAAKLKSWLPRVKADNNQAEYYLPDIIGPALEGGDQIVSSKAEFLWEIEGVNDKIQLNSIERAHQGRLANQLMAQGVALADASRLDIRGSLSCGRDVFIDVNAVFEGEVTVGDGVTIGPNCVIKDSHIGSHTELKSHTVLEGARIEGDSVIGPYARLRPGTHLATGAKIGNFVETKKSNIGAGSKVNHLAYIGDSEIGSDVNIGAGTITCNYDGANKYPTTIGDGVFVGSNSTLVAPLEIEAGAFVGAGSTITKMVRGGELAIARTRQRHIANWQKPEKKKS